MKVKVIKANLSSYWYADKVGEVFEVIENKNGSWDFQEANNREVKRYFDKGDVEIIEEKKQIKREDKINIEMTLQDAAWLYAISARANGTVGYSLYKTLKSFVDPDGVAYNKFIADKFNLIDYRAVQEAFEAEIFGRKSAEQKQLDILMQQITDLQAQAEKLQDVIGK